MPASRETAQVRWGILGTGRIAHTFAGRSRPPRPAGSWGRSRSAERARGFAGSMGALHVHADYQACSRTPRSTPSTSRRRIHPTRGSPSRPRAPKKHVLCEKPLGMNHAEVMAMFDAARRHGVFLMEAFMYRCHPLTRVWWSSCARVRSAGYGPSRPPSASRPPSIRRAVFSIRSSGAAGFSMWAATRCRWRGSSLVPQR